MLNIFVEGPDDERFYSWYFSKKKCDYNVKIIPYANSTKKDVNNHIKNIKLMGNRYILTADIDSKQSISDKKDCLIKLYPECEYENIIIAKVEIESWYLAGLNRDTAKALEIKLDFNKAINTEGITKEKFNRLIPKKFKSSRINFMNKLLENYSILDAIKQNSSIKYFHKYYR